MTDEMIEIATKIYLLDGDGRILFRGKRNALALKRSLKKERCNTARLYLPESKDYYAHFVDISANDVA